MTKSDAVDFVIGDVGERSKAIVEGGHSNVEILGSAMADLRALGGVSGVMSIMTSGKLSAHQSEVAKRIAVKLIAVLGAMESEQNKGSQ